MKKAISLEVKHSVCGPIVASLISAKEELRDRLFAQAAKDITTALAVRKARRFIPAPSVNVVGVGIGEKMTAGRQTGEQCVKVLVAKKFPLAKIDRAHRLPSEIAGLPTDIEEVGYAVKFQLPQRRRWRPVVGGVSVGLDFQAVDFRFAGTLGVIVADRQDPGRLYALSNNHVLADENRAADGAGVVQPGTLDGGRNSDRVGRLARYARLLFNNRRNWMDAAIAEFDNPVRVNRAILGIGTPTGAAKPSLNLVVRKSGRTTGLTEGIVRVVNFDVNNVQYDQGLVRVDDVIVIYGINGSFSKPGDSGSAIVDPQGRVVALLFAGSSVVTYAIPIGRILRRFKVRIAT